MQDVMNTTYADEVETLDEAGQVARWLSAFEQALLEADREALQQLFAEDAHWRDLVAITWSVTPSDSRKNVADTLLRYQPRIQAKNFRIAEGRTPPRRVVRAGRNVIEALFQFETAAGRCIGVLRLPIETPGQAWVMSTSLRELKGFEEAVGPRRPEGDSTRIFGGEAWGIRREKEQQFEDRDPTVLIVGGGHNGLALAARLRMLGVESLVVERLPRVGDVWRRRYSALALHNEIELNHLPYMPFPANWPKYLPKDMLGDWIEAYAKAMECNVWTATEFVHGRYDEERGVWTAKVRNRDGTERTLHPRHLVFANGVVGEPKMPDIPTLKDFKGTLVHAQGFESGAPWRGKKAIVIGVGNSAHDIAQDLHGHGASVKMVQRSSVTVFSVKAASINHAIHYKEKLSLEDSDLIATAGTFQVQLRGYQLSTQKMLEIDKDLLAGLKARGFKWDIGPQGGGHQMKIRGNHGGYYLNVGCSDLIVNGEIGLIQHGDIDKYVPEGILMKDGRVEEADLIVAATGYQAPLEVVRDLLGDSIAEKVGPIWGLDEGGEMRNMYKPTPQRGLWFTGGGFAQGRIWSHYVALQIKAHEAGLVS